MFFWWTILKFINVLINYNQFIIPFMQQSSYSFHEESDSSIKRPYHRVTSEKKRELLHQIFKNKMKVTKAALKVGLNLSTAKYLVKNYKRQHNIVKKTKLLTATTHQNNIESGSLPLPHPPYPAYYYLVPQNTAFPAFPGSYFPAW